MLPYLCYGCSLTTLHCCYGYNTAMKSGKCRQGCRTATTSLVDALAEAHTLCATAPMRVPIFKITKNSIVLHFHRYFSKLHDGWLPSFQLEMPVVRKKIKRLSNQAEVTSLGSADFRHCSCDLACPKNPWIKMTVTIIL